MSETDPLDLWYKAEAEATAYESAAVIWRAIKEAERRAYERAAEVGRSVFMLQDAHDPAHVVAERMLSAILSLSSEETK